jgi:cysteinyl-tRNA synthetase
MPLSPEPPIPPGGRGPRVSAAGTYAGRMLRLSDTRHRQATAIEPSRRGQLRVYSCGPDAGRDAHLGDLRTALLADLIRRAAQRHRLSVLTCQDIADVGDAGVEDAGEDSPSARRNEDAFEADCSALNIRPPDYSPRASESIGLITDLIGKLISGGHAYATADGSVYFDARSFPGYGELSGRSLDELSSGGGPGPGERAFRGDWVLWQGVPAGGAPGWPAPWGPGRPGRPAQRSAISLNCLGDVIDVRVGRGDLLVPGHEQERAQSDSLAGHEVVRTWVHGGPVLFEGREMPASGGPAGPAVLLAELGPRGLDPLALRLVFLRRHYRQQLDLTWPALADADRALRRWREQVADWATHPSRPMSARHVTEMAGAFDDDLDSPAALAALQALARSSDVPPGAKFETFAHIDQLFGLDLARDIGRPPPPLPLPAGAGDLLAQRAAAREGGDLAGASRLTEELASRGVTVTDTPVGQHWTVERGD